MFDITINLGTVLQTVVIVFGAGAFIWRLHSDLKLVIQQQGHVSEKITRIENRVDELSKVTIEIARQDQQLLYINQKIDSLENKLEATRSDARAASRVA